MSATERVWYVSYGSNLNRERFLAYLKGGVVPGNDVVHSGCRDTSPPVDDVPLTLPHQLYFAGRSTRSWGGTSAAFVTLALATPGALARAYLITQEQFLDVVRQENAHGAGVDDFVAKLEQARAHRHPRLLPTGTYSELIFCGERDGHPMLTFTASEDRQDFGVPSGAYLRVIGCGLMESHGLTSTQVVAYLTDRPGVHGAWTHDQLTDLFDASHWRTPRS